MSGCIMSLEEKTLAESAARLRRGSAGEISLLVWNCSAHTAVLSMKPIIKSTGIDTGLVRQAHLLESGRALKNFEEAVMKVIDESFRYQQVDREPPELGLWQRRSARYMQLSRPARDLDPDTEARILSIDNGNWDDEACVHWCIRGRCPHNCNGDARKSKRIFKDHVRISICGGSQTPLEYRWKVFESYWGLLFGRAKTARLAGKSICKTIPKESRR